MLTKEQLKRYLSMGLDDCQYELERLVLSRYYNDFVGFTQEQMTELHNGVSRIYDKYPATMKYNRKQQEAINKEIDEYLDFNLKN